jgi:hypothetical protein
LAKLFSRKEKEKSVGVRPPSSRLRQANSRQASKKEKKRKKGKKERKERKK